MDLKIFSFFSGCGLLDLGFEKTGYDIQLVNEFSPSFMRAYRYSREKLHLKSPEFGYSIDINEYLLERSDELREQVKKAHVNDSLVGFIGGPPCPDFSVAGKQRGRNGDNGKLSLAYFQLIKEQCPDFFLFENVKGLWKTTKHRAYYEELKQIIARDYAMTERLTNALEFGVPQDRDRILLFGVNKKIRDDITDFPWEQHIIYDLVKIKSLPWPVSEPFSENESRLCPDGIPQMLTVQYWFDKNDVEHHPNGKDVFAPRGGYQKMLSIYEGDDSKKSYKRLHRWRYSPTVAYGNNEVHLHPYKARRISVAEALALQSLPKEFELPSEMSLTDKFKTTGNGVPFLLSKGIAKTIKYYLGGEV